MMAEDLGVEAKEASVREVAKLLPLPELLQSISSIKADYIARQQVVSVISFLNEIVLIAGNFAFPKSEFIVVNGINSL